MGSGYRVEGLVLHTHIEQKCVKGTPALTSVFRVAMLICPASAYKYAHAQRERDNDESPTRIKIVLHTETMGIPERVHDVMLTSSEATN